ncbi:DUF3137 domain-containing protein [Tropicibacter sp. R15_0]|uniref:DUF3137 domain-containing protein n=1 Tax=Tropicibacter sp. R15_0 TaxID=2821101 RepID=UPI001ADA72CE|nr:DUF3137 domain-containing protein [Tropicibacter sp. R15_0]MBO9465955.1 DUF3137 domain-containing protein [Tropicibacter sp. R15_0]
MEYLEKLPIEKGFAEVFYDRIEPELNMLETQRQSMRKEGQRNFWIIMGIGIAISIAAFFLLQGHDWQPMIMFAGIGGGFFVAMIGKNRATGGWSSTINDVIMPPVCDFVGDMHYDRYAGKGFGLSRFTSLKLVANYDDASLEDRIEGTYNGVDYAMVEATLTKESTDSDGDSTDSTVFRGLLFRISLLNDAPCPILITKDYGKLGNRFAGMFSGGKGRGMPRVETGHPEFERFFELHADHGEAALEYLPDAFLDNLMDLGSTDIRCAFDGRDFLMAMGRKQDFLKMPGINQPMSELTGEINKVFVDLAMIRRVIDRLTNSA